jgi:uncharacterized protein with PQ loop repeat
MNGVAVVAGSISTALFVVSALPMLYKAARTKELGSYSLGYLLLANVGNGFYSIYVFSMPVGPIWALHSFYVVSSALMLFWYLRYEVSRRRHASAGVDRAVAGAPPPDVLAPESCPPPVAAPPPDSLATDRRQASPLAMVGPV